MEGTGRATDRAAAEWGLAALITGGVLMLAAAVTIVTGLQMELLTSQFRPGDVRLAETLSFVGSASAGLLCLASVGFGVRALYLAAARKQPAGLALAGTLMSLAALVCWVVAAVALAQILGGMG
jgi:hypothetical protein